MNFGGIQGGYFLFLALIWSLCIVSNHVLATNKDYFDMCQSSMFDFNLYADDEDQLQAKLTPEQSERLVYCMESVKIELEDSVDLDSLPEGTSLIALVKHIFFIVGGNKTWPKIGGNNDEINHADAMKNLINFMKQPKPYGEKYEESVNNLQNFMGNLSKKVSKSVEPLLVHILDTIDYEEYNRIDFDMAHPLMDFVLDVELCNTIFERKVHFALMSLCLLDAHTRIVDTAQNDEIAKNEDLNILPAMYLNSEGNLHQKYKSDWEKLKDHFFFWKPVSYSPMQPWETAWFLERMLYIYETTLVDSPNKEDHEVAEMIRKYLDGSKKSP